MFRRTLLVAALCAVFVSGQAVSTACAVGRVLLGFGSSYASAAGGDTIHRGVDVSWSAGEPVESPADGEVTFAGRVPSSAGGTMLAVSISTASGSLTLMPFDSIDASRGDAVRSGEVLGRLAEDGDPSTAEPHLHVGLKRGGVYLDPGDLLAAFAVDAQPERPPLAESCSESVPEGTASPAQDAVPAPVVVTGPILLDAPSPVTLPAVQPASAPQVTAEPGELSVSPQPVGVEPRACPAPQGAGAVTPESASRNPVPVTAVVAAQAGVPHTAASATGGTASPLATCLSRVLQARGLRTGENARPASPWRNASTGVASPLEAGGMTGVAVSPLSMAVAALAAASVILLLSRRSLERRIVSNTPASDRFGSMLQHLRAGDTLCGLTSCSGLLPSQSRGRIAQRR